MYILNVANYMLDGDQLSITSEGETDTITIKLTSSTLILSYKYLDEVK